MAVDTPSWLSGAIIYSVFVRNHGKSGGFKEVTRDLERIRELGSDIVWLMPIQPIGKLGRKGGLGSPYAISDYRSINPELGTESDLVELIQACHALGMKIIIDVVYNHTSPDSLLATKHPEWFLMDEAGKPKPKFPDWSDIVDLKYYDTLGNKNQELWDYQIESLRHWVKLGIDGFRCDVASLVPPEFWLQARTRLSAEKELIWLAESTHLHFIKFMRQQGHAAWSDGEILPAFDLTYDYDGMEQLDQYFAGSGQLRDYLHHLDLQTTMNPLRGGKLRFAENHDQPRIAAKIRGMERLRSWTCFHTLLPGAFLIYAGQELNHHHTPSLFEKDPIDLPIGHLGTHTAIPALIKAGFSHHQANFYPFFQKVLSITTAIKQECTNFAVIELLHGVVAIRWGASSTQYIAILNLEDRFGKFGAIESIIGQDLLSNTQIKLEPGSDIPKEPLILKLK